MLAKLTVCAVFLCLLGWPVAGLAQDSAQIPTPPDSGNSPGKPNDKPKIRVNVLNVCSPTPAEQQEIASALQHIPRLPVFAPDFEVSRGVSTSQNKSDVLSANASLATVSMRSQWVRVRREFTTQPVFSSVQYSFSVDEKSMLETTVFHVNDPKDLLEVAIEDGASAVTTPTAMLSVGPAAARIKLERFGKSSIVLARCTAAPGSPAADQSALEPLFQSAAAVVANYRDLLRARALVPDELARIRSLRKATTTGGKAVAKSPSSARDKRSKSP